MSKDWYRWNTVEEAEACLNYLNSHDKLPIVGVNANSKEPAPEKQQTQKWAEAVTPCADGKFGFPRVTNKWLDDLNIPQSERDLFMTTFNPTIEPFDESWIPAPVGEEP